MRRRVGRVAFDRSVGLLRATGAIERHAPAFAPAAAELARPYCWRPPNHLPCPPPLQGRLTSTGFLRCTNPPASYLNSDPKPRTSAALQPIHHPSDRPASISAPLLSQPLPARLAAQHDDGQSLPPGPACRFQHPGPSRARYVFLRYCLLFATLARGREAICGVTMGRRKRREKRPPTPSVNINRRSAPAAAGHGLRCPSGEPCDWPEGMLETR